ncbi:uncharacterized protein LOC8273070 isoform X1 [Ricinus communis]|uniref:uncharacterized protein LOC8273070 isoform X1 n=1 Tax=Ricinus communis TaxID=3988 RepID=UPI00201A27D6|nr:uncharacterized protein LOC8273070 isoform X1 [Ricinus communis]XP_015570921.2 uncharacterized protein LOC8273070 isoform X1 [Ricinus communis]XP_025011979.2 uncharacterized protein LOC8273070 isoform X1 [Ricinus communis]
MKANSGIFQLEQISLEKVLSGASSYKCNEQEPAHLPEVRVKEFTCLEPHLVDVCNRSCCRPIRNLPPPKDNLHNILNSFLMKDDLEYRLDDNSSYMGLLSCSPPVRTSNPLVYDVKFIHQNLVKKPTFGNSMTDHHSGVKVSCHGTSEEKQTIRIEDFDSGGSKSWCGCQIGTSQ